MKALGIGCRRGVTLEEIESAVRRLLPAGLEEISRIASCDIKADERALLDFARSQGKELLFFSSAELDAVKTPNPSARVKAQLGTASVCEAAALLASSGRLLIEKRKFGNVTLALAGKD